LQYSSGLLRAFVFFVIKSGEDAKLCLHPITLTLTVIAEVPAINEPDRPVTEIAYPIRHRRPTAISPYRPAANRTASSAARTSALALFSDS